VITKIIAVYACGSKVIRTKRGRSIAYHRNLVPSIEKPRLIQVFGYDFGLLDVKEVQRLRKKLHHQGQMTINGEHATTGAEWLRS
jgi:hypothetical protein